jgi:hypothetical protein
VFLCASTMTTQVQVLTPLTSSSHHLTTSSEHTHYGQTISGLHSPSGERRAASPALIKLTQKGDSLTTCQDVPNSLYARMSGTPPSHHFKLAADQSEVYRRNFDILNRGFNGYNSSWCVPSYGYADSRVLKLMDHIFAKKEDAHLYPAVRLVTIWLGVYLPSNTALLTESRNQR